MSQALICDRCNATTKTTNQQHFGWLLLTADEFGSEQTATGHHLCPGCSQHYYRWLRPVVESRSIG